MNIKKGRIATENTVQTLPFSKKIAYAAGQLGWSIASFGIMNLLNYFYDANIVNGKPMFPSYLPTIAILSLVAGGGRLLDAITDPIIAGLSDKCTHKLGRRRIFMAVGGIPFIVFSILVFIPPVAAVSWINGVWLIAMCFLFYLSMTIYITPYFALIAELGHNTEERLQLSTIVAVAWALGFMICNGTYALQGLLEQGGISSQKALQYVITAYGLVSAVLVYIPVFLIDEKKYCYPNVSKQGIIEAFTSAFKNRNFRFFLYADLSYFIALPFIQTGISYYVIQLLDLPKEQASLFMIALFLLSYLMYPIVYYLAKKRSKKEVLTLSFILFISGVILMSGWGLIPIPPLVLNIIIMTIMASPMAAFCFLLYATVGDIAEADGIKTGNYKEGLFFGSRTFMSKMGNSITLFIFPIVIHLGQKNITEQGLRLSLLLAAVFLIIGLIFYRQYDEKGVMKVLNEE